MHFPAFLFSARDTGVGTWMLRDVGLDYWNDGTAGETARVAARQRRSEEPHGLNRPAHGCWGGGSGRWPVVEHVASPGLLPFPSLLSASVLETSDLVPPPFTWRHA